MENQETQPMQNQPEPMQNAGSSSTAEQPQNEHARASAQPAPVGVAADASSNLATGTTNAPPPEAMNAVGRVKMCPVCWKPKWSSDPTETPICQCGNLQKMIPEVVKKLEEAFSVGANISQACFYAEISRRTYYNWIEEFPELLHRFTELQEKLPLKAKDNINRAIQAGSVGDSWRLLEKRDPDYTEKVKIDVNQTNLPPGDHSPAEEAAWQEYLKKRRDDRQRRAFEGDTRYQELKAQEAQKQDERPATGEVAGQVGGPK